MSPTVILLAGIPGAGKTALADWLHNEIPHFRRLSRDEIRRSLFQPADFSEEEKETSFQALLVALELILRRGYGAIVEGLPFSRQAQRSAVEEVSSAHGAQVLKFYLDCPPEIAVGRVMSDGVKKLHMAGDRTPSLVRDVFRRMDPFDNSWRTLDARRSTKDLGAQVSSILRDRQLSLLDSSAR